MSHSQLCHNPLSNLKILVEFLSAFCVQKVYGWSAIATSFSWCLQRVYTALVIRNFQTLCSYQNSIIRSKFVKRHTFLHNFGTGSIQINFFCWNKQAFVLLKLQEMCILATWNFHGKNEFMLKMYFLPLFWDKRQIVICVTCWVIFFRFRYFHNRFCQTTKQYKTVIICWNNLKSLCSWLNTCN